MKTKLFTALTLLLFMAQAMAQTETPLEKSIASLLKNKKATVGVAITGADGTQSAGISANEHFPMQSVFKFHLAIVVLSEVDKGHLKLKQEIQITKADLLPDTWSPIRDKYPDGGTLTLAQIIEYTVGQSDNIGCDILFRLVGGTQFADNYFQSKGFKNVAIKANEEEMHKDEHAQFTNWTTPAEANKVLMAYYANKGRKLLSKKSHKFLWQTMKNATSGPKRLKGELPQGTVVGHKTGTSGFNDKGVATATNDIGVVFLPTGSHFYISVFVSHSAESAETNEKLIADIAKLAFDYYNK
jgi:beta-lactamase class A